MQYRVFFAVAWAAVIALVFTPRAEADSHALPLKLEKGQHICIIGNTLPERMQHYGWLETLIHSRFPQHELVLRNLAFSGDEVVTRLRSKNFGSPHEWLSAVARPIGGFTENRFALTNTKADIIVAFFGFNESFAGAAGVSRFQEDLEKFIKDTLSRQYNAKSPPLLVLFSPIAHEDLKNRNFPDGSETNKDIKLYTDAMAETARANGVPFVDLFSISQRLYGPGQFLTINGVHINEHGDRLLSAAIDQALFGPRPAPDWSSLEKLRQAVLDKSFHWFHRYRTTDGYSTYGDRAFLKFTDGQTNYEVLQRELATLDVMTSNRDRRIWALAQGSDQQVDDSNLPPPVPVVTNRPGPGPDGSHLFLSAEEAIGKMQLAPGMKANLFASEEQFPELVNPVQMAWDTKGRLWIAAWPTYPHWNPREPMNDKLLILEDTDGDGKADKCTTFAGDLHSPTGFEFYDGGVLVSCPPYVLFLKDTDGDDRADYMERILGGIDSADTHHSANSFTFDPGGALYFQEGVFHRTQVETPYGPMRNHDAAVWRFEPRTSKFEHYTAYGFANPHGHVWDRWGQDFVHDGTSAEPFWGTVFSTRVYYPARHPKPPKLYNQRTRPCGATEILSSRHFPDENQGNLLVANVIGFLGILQYRITDRDSGFMGTEVEPIVQSSDPNFRPVDIEMGPDGAIYFTDWHNPIIGHMQHNLRDPSRDKLHGRVYRITYEDRPLLKPAAIAGATVEKLLDLLKEPENRVRYRAKIELSGRNSDDVIAAVKKWTSGLDERHPDYEHHMTEALWVHQWHNVVNDELLKRMLRSPDYRARAAATRVLCYWRDRVSNPLDLLAVQVNDDHPRVRIEAVRACSFFKDPKAIEVALESLNHLQDPFLKYCLDEAMKTLEKHTR